MTDRQFGILAHPTSFPGKYGIGDIGPFAYSFIDFLKKSGASLWQVLPLGHTSFGDSPYQCFSAFAGNPLLISPDLLKDEWGLLTDADLTDVPFFDENSCDYGTVIQHKMNLFRTAHRNFAENAAAHKSLLLKYKNFCKEKDFWLSGYTLFVALKDYFIRERKDQYEPDGLKNFEKQNPALSENQAADCYYGAAWNSWPEPIASFEKRAIREWTERLKAEIDFYKFLQFAFYEQWTSLKQYANASGISIIGDLPIFVSADSVDVWQNRGLFLVDDKGAPTVVAGVPPDYFSETGQLWGNPLYNWDVLRETGYEFWEKRISSCLELTDFIRIDHFRGFESYWSIPAGAATAISGKWNKGPGKEMFLTLKRKLGTLPIIAEDLGIITDKVTKLRESLGFPGMKVLQFGFDAGHGNLNIPHNFDSDNVIVYTGTHDNNTTNGWYETSDAKIRDQFRRYMNTPAENPAWDLIRLAFLSIAKIAVIPIQDVLSLGSGSRMNTPGISSGNWRFRFTEEMLAEELADSLYYLGSISDRLQKREYMDKELSDDILCD